MIDVDFEIDISRARRAIMTIVRTDMRPVFREIRGFMRDDQRDHQKRRMGPDGKRWKPLAASTKERYAAMGNRRNFGLLGRLPHSKKSKIDKNSITMFSPVKWSLAHQDGPTIVGRGSLLPGRQFFWISKKLQRQAAEAIEKFLTKKWYLP